MARKKTITREQILSAAYEVVAKEGFSRFTARNIAAKMKCSTQPIYLEFKNMDDLKTVLVAEILDAWSSKMIDKVITGNRLVDLGLNCIEFANQDKQLYKALYLEGENDMAQMKEYSYDFFVNTIIKGTEYDGLTAERTEALYTGFWILISGLAALTSSSILDLSQEEIIELLTTSFETMKHSKPVDLSFKTLRP
ncbi:TetR/AcrR family transcriptional regulator [Enterococcus saccharolyticus]|uniref:TetR family transcriptional regulator n=1 Tax=Candidatus Enterococcus willemsii TaxID=1857215 RepID=A0ABQ6YYL6_9ENTE|nr:MULTISPECIES: TetR/AcrR family transcriptional regulator [Enterococcus]KAF1303260.1 TetR family transcriptional regulator [Enterococcus sp. CU12B]MCD5001775.1 TetR/AcrR family transcriptional regulator [Enterococcus saccharolyticus]